MKRRRANSHVLITGQSYRPGGARERTPPPQADTYRARSPPRRDFSDSYRGGRPRSRSPPRGGDFRRRSPSPRFRDRDARAGGDSYRGRPRSPPVTRREDLPRDDLFRREPARDTRDYRDDRGGFRDDREYAGDRDRGYGGASAPSGRSPPRYRDRSPVPLKRGRELSPLGSRGRQTPPPKRERLQSPRGRYDEYPGSRPQSPPRRRYSPDPRDRRPSSRDAPRDYRARSRSPVGKVDRVEPRPADEWRAPRSPTPPRYGRQDYPAVEENGRNSGTTSHRSSPPLHPSRMPQVDDRAVRPPPRDQYDTREPYRAQSPEPRRAPNPPRELEYTEERSYGADDRIPPPREPYRGDDIPPPRAPPTGPAGYRAPSSSMAPPTGPSASVSRAPFVPPSGPRIGGGPPRGDFGAPRGRGGFRGGRGNFDGPYAFRGGRGGGPPSFAGRGGGDSSFAGRGGPPPGPSYGRGDSFDRDAEYGGPPPTGPSGGGPPSGPRGSFSSGTGAPPPQTFRQSNNSTATTYPRSQRFGPGGQPVPESPRSGTPTGMIKPLNKNAKVNTRH